MNEKLNPAPIKGQEQNLNLSGSDSIIIKPTTETQSQQFALLSWMKQKKRLTTLIARETLGVMHPAGRIRELRLKGHNIQLHWLYETDVTGTKHLVGEYVLHEGKYMEVALWITC